VSQLTRKVLFTFLCHDGKDTENLHHNPHEYICHSMISIGRGDLCIGLQPSEDVFYAREKVKEWTSTVASTLSSLRC
jgi:hypothetical protein